MNHIESHGDIEDNCQEREQRELADLTPGCSVQEDTVQELLRLAEAQLGAWAISLDENTLEYSLPIAVNSYPTNDAWSITSQKILSIFFSRSWLASKPYRFQKTRTTLKMFVLLQFLRNENNMFFVGWPPFPLLGLFTYLLNVTSYCNAWLLVCQDSAPKSSHWLVNSLKCHLTFSFSWSLLTLLKLFLLFESSILNFQPKHRKGASIASAPSSLRGRKRETQKPGDCTLRLEKKPWTILKILPKQNLQCREMEGLQATATPHSFVQSRQTLREDFLLSQPANDEHGLKVVEKGGDDSWGSFCWARPMSHSSLLNFTGSFSSQATSKSIPAQWIWNAYAAWPGSPKI